MFRKILVPLDGSDTAERALPHAVALARLFGARLALVRVPEAMVVPVMSGAIWVTEQVETREAAEEAERYVAEVAGRPSLAGVPVDTVVPAPPVASALLQTIEAGGADLVVMTSHGYSGFQRWVFGSVAGKVVHAGSAPVYVVREVDAPPIPPVFRHVLVALDGSEAAEAALPTAAALARASGATLTLMQVPTVPSYVTGIPETAGWIPHFLREQASEATLYLQAKVSALVAEGVESDIDVEVVTAGTVADGILASARQHSADVVIMSTHGRSGLGRWMFGSVADQVLRAADRPVWLVRARGA